MIKVLYPAKDATLYERFDERNTGVDQILELTKVAQGSPVAQGLEDEYWEANYNTRILIQFDLREVFATLTARGLNSGSYKAYLVLRATEAESLPIEYTVYAHAVSGSWDNGTGYYNNLPEIKNGVSWRYRTAKSQNRLWETASLASGVTSSFQSAAGGGVYYYTASAAVPSRWACTQSFNYEAPDLRMDVTPIVDAWRTGVWPNHGFLLKHSDTAEQDTSILGSIKFFAKDTHTIFIPRLEVAYDDTTLSGTGSFVEATGDDFVVYLKNLHESYGEQEKPKIRLGVRDVFPTPTYATSSNYLVSKRLSTSSFYSVLDSVTDEVIIPFDDTGSRVGCDSQGNYIHLDMNAMLPERYYRLIFKTVYDGGETVRIIDDGYNFRVYRQ
jgi:hypothetical protein